MLHKAFGNFHETMRKFANTRTLRNCIIFRYICYTYISKQNKPQNETGSNARSHECSLICRDSGKAIHKYTFSLAPDVTFFNTRLKFVKTT